MSERLQQLRAENRSLRDQRRQLLLQQHAQQQAAALADAEVDAARLELADWRRSELLPDRLRGALVGMLLGDALAVPTHFYPDQVSIERHLGAGPIRGFRPPPPTLSPGTLVESAQYSGTIDILGDARRFYAKPQQRSDGKGSHPHRGLAVGENSLNAELGVKSLLGSLVKNSQTFIVPSFLESMRHHVAGPEASHRDVYTYPWLRAYFERLSAAEAAAKVGPRRAAAATAARQKRGQPLCHLSNDEGSGPPGSVLVFIVPVLLGGISFGGHTGCGEGSSPAERAQRAYAKTVHCCVELVSSLLLGNDVDVPNEDGLYASSSSIAAQGIADGVAMWCGTLWDVLCPLLFATDPAATVFARAAPAPDAVSHSVPAGQAPPDPCDELLLQLRRIAETETGSEALTPDVWISSVKASCMLGGDSTTRAALTGGILGAAVGFSKLPSDLVDSLRDRHEAYALIDSFVWAVTTASPTPPGRKPRSSSSSSLPPSCGGQEEIPMTLASEQEQGQEKKQKAPAVDTEAEAEAEAETKPKTVAATEEQARVATRADVLLERGRVAEEVAAEAECVKRKVAAFAASEERERLAQEKARVEALEHEVAAAVLEPSEHSVPSPESSTPGASTEPTQTDASPYQDQYSGGMRGPVPLGTWAGASSTDTDIDADADTGATLDLREENLSPRAGGDNHQNYVGRTADMFLAEADCSSSTPTTDWESAVGSPISRAFMSPRSSDSFASAEDGPELELLHRDDD